MAADFMPNVRLGIMHFSPDGVVLAPLFCGIHHIMKTRELIVQLQRLEDTLPNAPLNIWWVEPGMNGNRSTKADFVDARVADVRRGDPAS